MINLEDYTLPYLLYEEGRKLEVTEAALELQSLTESNSEILEEGVKESIKNFVTKIVKGVQSAWDKFKSNFSKDKLKHKPEDIEKAIASKEPTISVEDYISYDIIVLDNIKIEPLNYTTMKSSLTDKKEFFTRFYSSIFTDKEKSISENIRNKCIKGKESKRKISKEDLVKMYSFVKNFKEVETKLTSDIEEINKASNATNYITTMVSNESVVLNESGRSEVLEKAIKALEDEGLTPKITPRDKKQWINTGSSGHFGSSLCIAGLGNDNLVKHCSKVNEIIKPLGGHLSPDNYGTAFLSVKESYISEADDAKPKVVSDEESENKEGSSNDSKGDNPQKHIQVYFGCITEILSAKLKMYREIYSLYKSVIESHTNSYLKGSKENKSKETNDTVNTTPQVQV